MPLLPLAVTALAVAAAAPASAAVVFDNPANGITGNCRFSTTCGTLQPPLVYAGQRFTLSASTTLTSGTFSVYTNSVTQPTSVSWLLLAADGADGLPGTLLASGSTGITTRTNIGTGFGFNLVKMGYDLPLVTLSAGTYYVGLQAVSNLFEVYLASASAFDGAVQSANNGVTWTPTYQNMQGVAVSLSAGASGAVPEPTSWAMLIAGFGLVGAVARRRRATLAA